MAKGDGRMIKHEYIKMALSLGAGIAVRWTEGFIPAVLALSEIDGGSDYRPWVTAHLLRPKSNRRQPRAAAACIRFQYMKSLPATSRARSMPPP